MANRNATLYIRITKNGKSSFCKPVYQSKGRLKPQYAMVDGEPEHHKEGVYYVRFGADGGKQQFVLAGNDPYVALDKLEEKKRWVSRKRTLFIAVSVRGSKGQRKSLIRGQVRFAEEYILKWAGDHTAILENEFPAGSGTSGDAMLPLEKIAGLLKAAGMMAIDPNQRFSFQN
jgi:hypothetical protein